MNDDAAWIDCLPEPVLLLGDAGRTAAANAPATALASRHGLAPDLEALFGRPAAALVERARREGRAEQTLALLAGDGAPVYKVVVGRGGRHAPFTAQLIDVSGEAVARGELTARNRELAVLNEIGMALSSTLELDALAGRIHEQAGRIMNTFNLYVAMHDAERDTISFPVRIEGHQRLPDMPPRPYANGLTEFVIRTRQPLLLNGDVRAQARALGLDPIGRAARSWMATPLLAEGRAIGVIALQDHDGTGGYDEHDLEVLTVIAGQAAAAIRNARLLAEARGAYRELSAAHASLLETERLRGVTETVGALNHEINNPLATIAGNAQLLLRRPGTLPDGMESKVRRILEAAHRIQSVTARMANLIHATSMTYPGNETILDVSSSRARAGTEPADGAAAPDPTGASTGASAAA